ncbi:MAG: aminotransferase class I/II-fold pyridoxal phosphate-dependent enzyme, partial [Thermoguttaceae bacterium]|nr:aminotransferase class I/II-fold pyridoxal phosphate-dependent enzyme [Thermoguttaceae bacterium]
FDEYPNRYNRENSVDFTPDNDDYSYTVDDLTSYFDAHKVDAIILVNPDNPSGNYIPKAELLRLIEWANRVGATLVIDESFADFADELDNTLIDQAILDANPRLFVMKSISKSYGVPGLRLGVLASGDVETIANMKKEVAIWNINSFGEFYMQIEEKYKKDYADALVKFRAERKRFQSELAKIEGVRVIPSQANFVMVELKEGISPKELLKKLLIKHNLLIKELSTKTNGRNYLRLAVRNVLDNDVLITALKEELEK